MSSVNNKKIAKNTLLLYMRMILLMAVTLYTSRVILSTLGIEDYGTYNLIGGFITLFSFVSASLVSAVQRYLNVALGQNDETRFQQIYSMSIKMFAIFSVFLIIIGESVGYWFIKTQLNIPEGREHAAMWVYQMSLITLIVQLFRITDNASIIAYEKMGFYAYLSIGEAILKLGIVFLLQLIHCDKLILYVILYLGSTVIINIAYKLYCYHKFPSCRYIKIWDKKLFGELASFSSWTLLNSGTHTLTNQGVNFFMNRYYSVSLNAAQGIAAQVYNAINTFLVNFQTAFKPQLIKSYASGDMDEHYKLINRTSKFSYYLMLVIVLPFIFNMRSLLALWLVEIPEYTEYFCLYILFAYLADAVAAPLQTSIHANGKIRGLQISMAILYILQLVVCFFFLREKLLPYIASVVTFIVHALFLVPSLYYAKKLCGVNVRKFLKIVLLPTLLVTLVSLIVPYFIKGYGINIWHTLLLCFIDVIWAIIVIFAIGLNKEERSLISCYILTKIRNKN